MNATPGGTVCKGGISMGRLRKYHLPKFLSLVEAPEVLCQAWHTLYYIHNACLLGGVHSYLLVNFMA